MRDELAARYQSAVRGIVGQLVHRYRPERVLAVGSYARGELCEDRDA